MKRFGTILLSLIVLLIAMWQLPWLYSFLKSKKEPTAFVLYSSLIDDFITSATVDGKRVHHDTQGNSYLQNEVDSLLPFFYARQLLKDERFPTSVKGIKVSYKSSQNESFMWRSAPRDINTPKIGVYQLMESSSSRVNLETPPDVFRITKQGLEFVDAETNTINLDKSTLFTETMRKKGFEFPAIYLSGNPSIKKEYDQGYLVLDSKGALFHLKQLVGRPFVRKIDLPQDMKVEHLFITEHRNRKSIGYISDTQHRLYVVELPSYAVRKIEIPSFSPQENGLMIYANPMEWTIKLTTQERTSYYAVDANNYTLIKSYEELDKAESNDFIDNLFRQIGIRFTSSLDKFVYPRMGK